jgi:hypothetical protein
VPLAPPLSVLFCLLSSSCRPPQHHDTSDGANGKGQNLNAQSAPATTTSPRPSSYLSVPRLLLLIAAAALVPLLDAGRAAAQQSSTEASSVRVKAQLQKVPTHRLNLDWNVLLPGVTFRTSVEQRVYVLSFKEQLAKEFKLTPIQQQSQEWASRCCGVNLVKLVSGIEKRLERRRERRTREEVARELARVQAAAAR